MSQSNDKNRPPSKPGKRAVGFRAPSVKSNLAGSGFSTRKTEPPQAPKTEPEPITTTKRNAPPVKKRAKGSGFFAFLFLAFFATAGYFLWSSFLQYQSYGVIDGRLISVAAPWDGNIVNWQVRDGDLVQQGDIVATLSNLEMQHELEALNDELKMTQAQLDAQMTKIKFDVQDKSERSQKAMAEYLQASGELQSEKAAFQDINKQLDRAARLLKNKNISRSEYEKLYYTYVGQKRKIERLEQAVEVLRARSETPTDPQLNGSSQLKPLLAKIERTQAEMARLRTRIDQGQVRAPVSGRVTKRFSLTGESVRQSETVIEILEDNSIEAVLYVPQEMTDEFQVGKQIEIQLEPYQYPMSCTVRRLGERFEPAPVSISRYYTSQQYLLPVYLTPNAEFNQLMAMKIHGTVKRPYEWDKSLKKSMDQVKQTLSNLSGTQTAKKLPIPESRQSELDKHETDERESLENKTDHSTGINFVSGGLNTSSHLPKTKSATVDVADNFEAPHDDNSNPQLLETSPKEF